MIDTKNDDFIEHMEDAVSSCSTPEEIFICGVEYGDNDYLETKNTQLKNENRTLTEKNRELNSDISVLKAEVNDLKGENLFLREQWQKNKALYKSLQNCCNCKHFYQKTCKYDGCRLNWCNFWKTNKE